VTQGLAHRGALTSQITTGLLDHCMKDQSIRVRDLAVSMYRVNARDGTLYLGTLTMANALYAVTHNITKAQGNDWRLANHCTVDTIENVKTIKGTRMVRKPLITARGQHDDND
jgi:hypothetical protein